jgi:hypothetical protein
MDELCQFEISTISQTFFRCQVNFMRQCGDRNCSEEHLTKHWIHQFHHQLWDPGALLYKWNIKLNYFRGPKTYIYFHELMKNEESLATRAKGSNPFVRGSDSATSHLNITKILEKNDRRKVPFYYTECWFVLGLFLEPLICPDLTNFSCWFN